MNVLITGGSGFIGTHLVEGCITRGYKVNCLVRRYSSLKYLQDKKIRFFQGDVTDENSLTEAVKDMDIVFHLAALRKKTASEKVFYKVNVGGTKCLLENCYRFQPHLKRFVYISSIAAAGPTGALEPLNEDAPCFPVDFYGKSKLEAEKVVKGYGKKLPITVIRPPVVYGPRDKTPRKTLWYMKMVKRGIKPIWRANKTYFNAIFVRDLVEGLMLAAESPVATDKIYFMCDERITSYDEICDLTASFLHKRLIRIKIPFYITEVAALIIETYSKITNTRPILRRQKNKKERIHWICDGSKAKEELGFQTKTSLDRGIRETITWYLENGWI